MGVVCASASAKKGVHPYEEWSRNRSPRLVIRVRSGRSVTLFYIEDIVT